MPRASTKPKAPPAKPEIGDPTLVQQILLDAPLGDDVCAITARGTGKSFAIPMIVARDSTLLKSKFNCLITRQTYQGLVELQGLLWRFLSRMFPGTTWSGSDMTFRLGGKDCPFGRAELAYTGTGAMEVTKALARLQGRSFTTAIHDEVGAHPDSTFVDTVAATLRAPSGTPTRSILLGNPGGPAHPWLQERFGVPAGYPPPGKPVRFFSEDLGKHCIFVTVSTAANQYLDFDAYVRNLRIACGEDEALLQAWLEGRLDVDIAGSIFGSAFSVRRSMRDVKPGGIDIKSARPFVAGDWGCAAPSVFYLCVPDPPGAPKGSVWMIDECYIAAPTSGGRRDWTRGCYLSNAEQADVLREWLERWGLTPNDLPIIMDDAVFNANGSAKGSVAGDFKAAGVRFKNAGKMRTREVEGLSLMRNMMKAAGTAPDTPWLLWSNACQGWMATIPTLPRHPSDPEKIAPGCANHAADAMRYGITWNQRRSVVGVTEYRLY